MASSSKGSAVGALAATSSSFEGSVLTLEAATAPSDSFDFVRAVAGGGRRVFEVKGDGRTDVYGKERVKVWRSSATLLLLGTRVP